MESSSKLALPKRLHAALVRFAKTERITAANRVRLEALGLLQADLFDHGRTKLTADGRAQLEK